MLKNKLIFFSLHFFSIFWGVCLFVCLFFLMLKSGAATAVAVPIPLVYIEIILINSNTILIIIITIHNAPSQTVIFWNPAHEPYESLDTMPWRLTYIEVIQINSYILPVIIVTVLSYCKVQDTVYFKGSHILSLEGSRTCYKIKMTGGVLVYTEKQNQIRDRSQTLVRGADVNEKFSKHFSLFPLYPPSPAKNH